ncbi:MAG: hypothetical protein AB9891_05645 [Anaerolineaceae bacterium]
MKRSTVIQIVIHTLVVLAILIVAFLPAISVAIAGSIANANGCQLDEGSVHPCIVNGTDMGETLYTMGVMGWLMLATIPLGLGAVVVYLLLVAVFYIVRGIIRRRQAVASQTV